MSFAEAKGRVCYTGADSPVLEESRMSFRVSALVTVAGVFGLAEFAPVRAQPQVPVRPRYSSFQNIFRPGVAPLVQPGPGFLGQQMPIGNAFGPLAPGFVYPNLGALPQALPGAYGNVNPLLPPTGVVGTFQNYSHWYGFGTTTGNYGHWYPNGLTNGRGVLSSSGGGGFGGLYGGPAIGGGFRTGGAIGAAATTGAMMGGAINQMRR